MSLDERVRDALTRVSQLVDPDERRELTTVRRRARRAAFIRRTANVALAATLVAAAVVLVPRIVDATRGTRRTPSGPATDRTAGHDSLVGAWTQAQSCEDFVRALTRYGLPHHVPAFLVANGYREGPTSAIATDPHPCRGASRAVQRTWVFDGTRLRGFIAGQKENVDIAFPEILDDHTIRVSHINLGFRIEGDTLHFIVPPIPRTCTGPDCLGQHAWAVAAFGLGPWTRTAER